MLKNIHIFEPYLKNRQSSIKIYIFLKERTSILQGYHIKIPFFKTKTLKLKNEVEN